MLERDVDEPRRVGRHPQAIEITRPPESAWRCEREMILEVIDRIPNVLMLIVVLGQQHRRAQKNRMSPPFAEDRTLKADALHQRRISRRLDGWNSFRRNQTDWCG